MRLWQFTFADVACPVAGARVAAPTKRRAAELLSTSIDMDVDYGEGTRVIAMPLGAAECEEHVMSVNRRDGV